MMGPRQVAQGALFNEFSIEEFVPQDHPMRGIDRFLDLTEVRAMLAPREAGGMPPSQYSKSSPPLSGRYSSFSEREEIALYRPQGVGR